MKRIALTLAATVVVIAASSGAASARDTSWGYIKAPSNDRMVSSVVGR